MTLLRPALVGLVLAARLFAGGLFGAGFLGLGQLRFERVGQGVGFGLGDVVGFV